MLVAEHRGGGGASSARWTAEAASDAEARIGSDLSQLAEALRSRLGAKLQAVLVIGGYARGEGSVVHDAGGPAPYNDYDLIVVVPRTDRPIRAALRRFSLVWSDRLGVEVDVWPVTRNFLRAVPPTLLWLDASLGGVRLLAGDPAVIDSVRRVRPREVPLDECGRLLANRAVGLALSNLERRAGRGDEHSTRRDPVETRMARHGHKAVLACGDVRLLAACRYAPTLAERADVLAELGEAPGVGRELVDAYRDAVAFRARPDDWCPPWGDLASWYARIRERVARWHLEYEAWRVHAPERIVRFCVWHGCLYGSAPDLRRAGLPAHLRAVWRGASPTWPYVGHPRERLARVAVGLAYGDEDPQVRRAAARLLGLRDPDDATLRDRLQRLTVYAG